MWTILTYAYNSILILFIAAHLLVGAIISFLTGLYMGIYLSQTYEIPRITEPSKVWERVILFMEQYRRRAPRSSFSSAVSLLHPQSVLNIVKEDDKEPYGSEQRPHSSSMNVHADSDAFDSTPGVILVDSDFGDENEMSSLRKSSSQILEATLIINSEKDMQLMHQNSDISDPPATQHPKPMTH